MIIGPISVSPISESLSIMLINISETSMLIQMKDIIINVICSICMAAGDVSKNLKSKAPQITARICINFLSFSMNGSA